MRVDNMLVHPGIELQESIKEKGLTQKAFSLILGKKVSEVNELLKGKRNITIQRDYLLHKTLGTPIKYWILKQIDYEYSLIDINDDINDNIDKDIKTGYLSQTTENKEDKISQIDNYKSQDKNISNILKTNEDNGYNLIKKNKSEEIDNINTKNSIKNIEEEKSVIKDNKNNNDEDRQKRINIFKTF